MTYIKNFVAESNAIEGIYRDPTDAEVAATRAFVTLSEITPRDLIKLVSVYQPDAVLRDMVGLNVRVGRHIPPPGSPEMLDALNDVLFDAHAGKHTPYRVHQKYEHLHPFTDGNGRSGRALWLWMMHGNAPLGFLHHWYYQSLQAGR